MPMTWTKQRPGSYPASLHGPGPFGPGPVRAPGWAALSACVRAAAREAPLMLLARRPKDLRPVSARGSLRGRPGSRLRRSAPRCSGYPRTAAARPSACTTTPQPSRRADRLMARRGQGRPAQVTSSARRCPTLTALISSQSPHGGAMSSRPHRLRRAVHGQPARTAGWPSARARWSWPTIPDAGRSGYRCAPARRSALAHPRPAAPRRRGGPPAFA